MNKPSRKKSRNESKKKQRPRRPGQRSFRRRRVRRVRPGVTYLITKKTNDDLFLILASPALNQILLYTLILKALRYGLLLHGFVFMSNHLHLVVTDVRGELPAFMREFLSDTSKAIQAEVGIKRRVWSSKRYSAVALLDLDAAERKVAYCQLNPSRAGLTPPEKWPGITSARWKFGDVISVERPSVYFSPRYRPDEVSGVRSPLPTFFIQPDEDEFGASEASEDRIAELMISELGAIERGLERSGRTWLGVKRVLSTPRETRGTHPVRVRLPRFATRDKALLAAALADEALFDADHESALRRYLEGHARTVFPVGTYGYRKLLGVRVAEENAAA